MVVFFPVISAVSDPSMKVQSFAAAEVEVQIVQCSDYARDNPDTKHLAAVVQSAASTNDDPGGDGDGMSGHRTAIEGMNAGTPKGDGTGHASSMDY